ncbi:acyl-CoA synthetase [Aliidongia dinghuensis]|uniref:Long-chain-fatty-acid--CoA ligase n=1 Tax=Aliidongia dinghuensis TaxID=1867774 RepID=A0A8J3E7R0_9PROT|nr:AMP-binding protein [Aliidongia dinghuensis]GGF48001.1 acyl-CoA synthetase [Aliidongia dinghuensis]
MSTLTALLAEGAARKPDAAAVTDGTGTLDWRAFSARVAGTAAQLRAAGVRPGDRVALWLPNSADYLALVFASARLGAVAIHVNTRFRTAEVGSLLHRSAARVLVTEWGFEPVDFPALLAAIPKTDRPALRLVIGRRLPAGVSAVAGLPAERLDPEARFAGDVPDAAAPDLPCLTFTTSGTTSGSKLVLHSQRAIAGHAADVMRAFETDRPTSALLACIPLCGTFGNAAAMAAIAGGAHVVCMDRFDGAEAAHLIRRHGITHAVGGDDLLARIIDGAAGEPFTTMRLFGFAAFHPGAAATAAAAEAIGLAPRGVYGSSEMQALFAASHGPNRLMAGGRPVNQEAEVSVRDPETGAVLPPGQSGELCFKAPSRFMSYLGNDEATRRATTADGFFRSGDLGRLDGDGFIYETRLGDTLRLGGFLVNPEEIEGFLVTLPGVASAQVVAATKGAASNAADAVPVAFVTAEPGTRLEEAALQALCRERIARFKVPARIAVVEAFPTTASPNGIKIQRAKLREMAEQLMKETV